MQADQKRSKEPTQPLQPAPVVPENTGQSGLPLKMPFQLPLLVNYPSNMKPLGTPGNNFPTPFQMQTSPPANHYLSHYSPPKLLIEPPEHISPFYGRPAYLNFLTGMSKYSTGMASMSNDLMGLNVSPGSNKFSPMALSLPQFTDPSFLMRVPEPVAFEKPDFATSKIKHLGSLYNLLIKIFLPESAILNFEMRLSRIERLLFVEFMKRKFRNIGTRLDKPGELSANDITDAIMCARGEKSAKRIEERKKFVYKHCLKKLKKEFFESEFYKANHQSKDLFYRYYFEEVARQKRVGLENFYDPLNQHHRERVYRTLSNLYLGLIFESPSFRKDFLLYMQSEDFLADYQKTIEKKIEKLLLKWEELFEKETPEPTIIGNIKEYFVMNRQCKLPWTIEEVTHAANSFVKFTSSGGRLRNN